MSTNTPLTFGILPPKVLAIGGSDSGGSAGIQADLKTYTARGVFGMTALTTVTAQNTLGVYATYPIPLDVIRQQISTVLADIGADAIKTGLLGRASVIEVVADMLGHISGPPLVVDPVLVDGEGRRIVDDQGLAAYQQVLFPLATLLTPNRDEASVLTGQTIQDEASLTEAAYRLYEQTNTAVLIKGGHLDHLDHVIDVFYAGEALVQLSAARLPIHNPHGVGCTLASAIAAELAKGEGLEAAVRIAHRYLQAALTASQTWQVGAGRPPVNHMITMPENKDKD